MLNKKWYAYACIFILTLSTSSLFFAMNNDSDFVLGDGYPVSGSGSDSSDSSNEITDQD